MKIPAITLWQPWASLVACGAKLYETRSWATQYKGRIAIHAAARNPVEATRLFPGLQMAVIRKALKDGGLLDYDSDFDALPFGCVVATVNLVNCWHIVSNPWTVTNLAKRYAVFCGPTYPERIIYPSGQELLFGDWTPGRYAWELADIKVLPEPIPARGHQGLWKWEVPEGVGEERGRGNDHFRRRND
jgi:hypothetical protein